MTYEVVIWGMGTVYSKHVNTLRYLELSGQIKVLAVTATEVLAVNTIDGYQVIEKKGLKDLKDVYLIVMNDLYYQEIIQEAMIYGVKREQIIPYRVLDIPDINFDAYIHLKRSNISIISDNCWGGIVCHTLGFECLSPFKNLFVEKEDYIKLLENLKWYLGQPLTFAYLGRDEHKPMTYPVMALGDIKIHCNHETDPKSAIKEWNRRQKKINYGNLLVEMYTERKDIIERFLALDGYKKKICFVSYQSSHPNLFPLNTDQMELWEAVNENARSGSIYYLVDLLNGQKTARCQ